MFTAYRECVKNMKILKQLQKKICHSYRMKQFESRHNDRRKVFSSKYIDKNISYWAYNPNALFSLWTEIWIFKIVHMEKKVRISCGISVFLKKKCFGALDFEKEQKY